MFQAHLVVMRLTVMQGCLATSRTSKTVTDHRASLLTYYREVCPFQVLCLDIWLPHLRVPIDIWIQTRTKPCGFVCLLLLFSYYFSSESFIGILYIFWTGKEKCEFWERTFSKPFWVVKCKQKFVWIALSISLACLYRRRHICKKSMWGY